MYIDLSAQKLDLMIAWKRTDAKGDCDWLEMMPDDWGCWCSGGGCCCRLPPHPAVEDGRQERARLVGAGGPSASNNRKWLDRIFTVLLLLKDTLPGFSILF
jgi:hypothetical protein